MGIRGTVGGPSSRPSTPDSSASADMWARWTNRPYELDMENIACRSRTLLSLVMMDEQGTGGRKRGVVRLPVLVPANPAPFLITSLAHRQSIFSRLLWQIMPKHLLTWLVPPSQLVQKITIRKVDTCPKVCWMMIYIYYRGQRLQEHIMQPKCTPTWKSKDIRRNPSLHQVNAMTVLSSRVTLDDGRRRMKNIIPLSHAALILTYNNIQWEAEAILTPVWKHTLTSSQRYLRSS